MSFTISKNIGTEDTPSIKYATVADDILTGWVDDQTNATKIETKTVNTIDGVLTVKGLDQGTYILTEVETLDGYNLLDDTITVTITPAVTTDDNGNVYNSSVAVTYKMTNGKNADGSDTTATETITIENETGSLLPSTGGMGTTIFYIVGAILVLGAAVLLITRRRMNADK